MLKLPPSNRTVLATVVILIAVSGMALGQNPGAGPRIKCTPEVFDFGYVPQDATVSHTYWLKNTGTETAVITQIKPNCGCTRVPPSDSTIAVGDSLAIELLFASRNMSGKVEKFTRIVSNAEGRVPALTFKGRVFKAAEDHGPITAIPAIIEIAGSTAPKLSLKNTSKSSLTVQVVDLPPGLIQLNWNELTLGPDETKEVSLALLPQENQVEITKSITLESNDSERSRLTVPITNVKKE